MKNALLHVTEADLMRELTTLTRGGMITIPAEIRKKHGLRAGMKIQIAESGEGLMLIPIIPLEELKGTERPKIAKAMCKELIQEHRKEASTTDSGV